jgi:5-methylcytosine-specific restriction endonuclease McrA
MEHSQEYLDYLDSPEWRARKFEIINQRGPRCQRCGKTYLAMCAGEFLSLHHKTYARLGKELAEDLELLCNACHESADKERRKKVEHAAKSRAWSRRLNGWATKVYGENWEDYQDYDAVEEEFQEWLESREEDDYDY